MVEVRGSAQSEGKGRGYVEFRALWDWWDVEGPFVDTHWGGFVEKLGKFIFDRTTA